MSFTVFTVKDKHDTSSCFKTKAEAKKYIWNLVNAGYQADDFRIYDSERKRTIRVKPSAYWYVIERVWRDGAHRIEVFDCRVDAVKALGQIPDLMIANDVFIRTGPGVGHWDGTTSGRSYQVRAYRKRALRWEG